MTRDEIMNMPAGREMDALIAEKVLGWTGVVKKPFYDRQDFFGISPELAYDSTMEYIHEYSTFIAAAWEVVDEMKRRGWEIRMEGVPVGQMVKFYNHKHDLRDGRPYAAALAPLAICRAALLITMDVAE